MAKQQPPAAWRPARTSRSTAARVLAGLLLAGALAYSTWPAEMLLPTGLSPRTAYVSELAAEDQPYGTFFRTVDLLAGLLVLAGAVWASTARRTRAGRLPAVGWAGLALFGAATAADSRLPLSCAATADPGCLARERAGDVPWTHTAHAVSSSLAVAGALVGMVLLTVAARRRAASWRALARTGPFLVALELVATGWTLTSIAAFEAGLGTWGLGIGQRLQVLAIAVWLVVLAWSAAAEARRE
ncbi:DUF998 domain-containing protein [Streptomyces venezuelae]|uniref:DUF998 domain-containing protein n=1 Tax=Streptomyces venezuelae TaxID=54571 RepID=A0A5P2BES0_STRVZ|nr:DUF998 domain-containing protein [Streptomyces venezuelae]QES26819.1 DUF998 domain-containing protein [Streptomyces venezuelae]